MGKRKKKYDYDESSIYGDREYHKYRKPYNSCGIDNYETKQYKRRWYRSTYSTFDNSDYNKDQDIIDTRIKLPKGPKGGFNEYYTKEDYESDCRDYIAKYKYTMQFPIDTKMYNGNKRGLSIKKANIERKSKLADYYTSQEFKEKHGRDIIKPVFFWGTRKKEKYEN